MNIILKVLKGEYKTSFKKEKMKWNKVGDDGSYEIYCGITESGEVLHKCIPKEIPDNVIDGYYS